MAPSLDALFRPFRIKSLTLRNRIVMAPMTRSFSPNGLPTPAVAEYYRRRAESEVGLIITEGTAIDRPSARNEPAVPYFYGEAPLAAWSRVAEAVHAAGGAIAPQLWHVGAARGPIGWQEPRPVESPSGLSAPDDPNGKPMTEEAIADTISAYAAAAADAKRLGFDCLELHAAHGYLIDQFFWSATNKRSDRWGGDSLAQRGRFAAEVLRAVRDAVGPDFVCVLRVSQFKMRNLTARLAATPGEMEAWLLPLVEAGADILHCSQRRFWQPEFPDVDGEAGLNFAGWAKKVTGAVTISVGSVGLSSDYTETFGGQISYPTNIDNLVHRMEQEEFDLIAVGRGLLADPSWVPKMRAEGQRALQEFNVEALKYLY